MPKGHRIGVVILVHGTRNIPFWDIRILTVDQHTFRCENLCPGEAASACSSIAVAHVLIVEWCFAFAYSFVLRAFEPGHYGHWMAGCFQPNTLQNSCVWFMMPLMLGSMNVGPIKSESNMDCLWILRSLRTLNSAGFSEGSRSKEKLHGSVTDAWTINSPCWTKNRLPLVQLMKERFGIFRTAWVVPGMENFLNRIWS